MIEFDEIGYWSELKLDIIKEYAQSYSKIISAQKDPSFYHIYIDSFSGSGVHISRVTGEFVEGSPLNALNINPPFKEYHFIDLKGKKVEFLENLVDTSINAYFHTGDCNDILIREVFPKCKMKEYKRSLCLLDPYGLQLNWDVIAKAAELKTIEIFLNFPIMDMQRNVLWQPDSIKKVSEKNIQRMNSFWGDNSWRDIAYKEKKTLFGLKEFKVGNKEIAQAFKKRIEENAGFKYVAEPLPMRNRIGAVIYYLFFASHKPVANRIVEDIFKKYSRRGFVK